MVMIMMLVVGVCGQPLSASKKTRNTDAIDDLTIGLTGLTDICKQRNEIDADERGVL